MLFCLLSQLEIIDNEGLYNIRFFVFLFLANRLFLLNLLFLFTCHEVNWGVGSILTIFVGQTPHNCWFGAFFIRVSYLFLKFIHYDFLPVVEFILVKSFTTDSLGFRSIKNIRTELIVFLHGQLLYCLFGFFFLFAPLFIIEFNYT